MVRPKGTRGNALSPSGKRPTVATAREHPRGIVRVAAAIGVERQVHGLGEVGSVEDGVLQREICKVLGAQDAEGAGFTPVAVLQQHHCTANGLGKETSDGPISQIAGVALGGDLAWGEEDNGGAGTLPVLAAPPESLVKSSQRGVIVIEELLEDALAGDGSVGGALLDVVAVDGLGDAKGRRNEVLALRRDGPGTTCQKRGDEEGDRLHVGVQR